MSQANTALREPSRLRLKLGSQEAKGRGPPGTTRALKQSFSYKEHTKAPKAEARLECESTPPHSRASVNVYGRVEIQCTP